MKILSLILSIFLAVLFAGLAIYLSISNGSLFISFLLLFASFGRARSAEEKIKIMRGIKDNTKQIQ
jgi:hypothetical protein